MTSPLRSTDAAGAVPLTSAIATVSGTVSPASRSPAAVALSWESDISAAFSLSTCAAVCPGGNTWSCGNTACDRESHAFSTSSRLTRPPGPPETWTVVMSRVPLGWYVAAPVIVISRVEPTRPRTLVTGPGA